MKNTIILLLCAIFLLGLAGCGGKSPDESVAPSEMREEKTTDSVDEADSKKGNDADESASGLDSPRDRTIPLSSNALHSLKMPLPPLAEQKRIVAKLEELLPLCERLK